MAEAVIKIIETRALASDPVKVSEQRSRKERITGLRVSLVSDKTKRGTVLPENGLLNIFDGGGKCFSVQIDDEPSSRSFSRTDLDLLCFYCQDEVASKRCSQCRYASYCSAECQRSDWKSHKATCKKPA